MKLEMSPAPISSLSALHLTADAIDAMLQGVSVVSLDVFDTILARRCLLPSDVFSWIEVTFNEPGFQRDRVNAESLARKKYSGRGSEVSIEEIYEALAELRDLPENAIERELCAEEAFLFPSPSISALIKILKDRGLRVIAVSDMYLSSAQIRRLLEKSGVWVDAVYSSADLRSENVGKFNGTIFPRLAEAENALPADIIHIGDNKISDVENGRRAGFRTLLVANLHELASEFSSNGTSVFSSAQTPGGRMVAGQTFHGALTCRYDMSTIEGYGYSYGGPILLGMVSFLIERAKDLGVEHVVLLERDGNILKEALDRLAPLIGPYSFTYRLAPSSRRMSIFPLVADYGFSRIESFFQGFPDLIEASQFFQVLGIKPEGDIDETGLLRTAEEHFQYYQAVLAAQAQMEREAIRRIFSSEISLDRDGKKVAWFDVGWGLSSATALNELLEMDWPCLCVGSHNRSSTEITQFGYLFERGHPEVVADPLMRAVELIELIFSSVTLQTNYAIPVGGAEWLLKQQATAPASHVRNAFVVGVWRGAMDFLDDIGRVSKGIAYDDLLDYNRRLFLNLAKHPNRRQRDMLMAVPHSRGAGDNLWSSIAEHWRPEGYSDPLSSLPKRKRKPVRDFIVYHVLTALAHESVPISEKARARFIRSAAKRIRKAPSHKDPLM